MSWKGSNSCSFEVIIIKLLLHYCFYNKKLRLYNFISYVSFILNHQ